MSQYKTIEVRIQFTVETVSEKDSFNDYLLAQIQHSRTAFEFKQQMLKKSNQTKDKSSGFEGRSFIVSNNLSCTKKEV